jgi:hypothetical protein
MVMVVTRHLFVIVIYPSVSLLIFFFLTLQEQVQETRSMEHKMAKVKQHGLVRRIKKFLRKVIGDAVKYLLLL